MTFNEIKQKKTLFNFNFNEIKKVFDVVKIFFVSQISRQFFNLYHKSEPKKLDIRQLCIVEFSRLSKN